MIMPSEKAGAEKPIMEALAKNQCNKVIQLVHDVNEHVYIKPDLRNFRILEI